MSAYTARLTSLNERTAEGWFDTVTIYKDGEEFDTVVVESTEEHEPYDEAVREVLGNAPYTWEN